MTAEDVAPGYKQLLELLARPAPGPHRREHVWRHLPNLRREFDRIAVGTFAGPTGTFRQRREISDAKPPSSHSSRSTRHRRSTSLAATTRQSPRNSF
jgi:hypothetical protein